MDVGQLLLQPVDTTAEHGSLPLGALNPPPQGRRDHYARNEALCATGRSRGRRPRVGGGGRWRRQPIVAECRARAVPAVLTKVDIVKATFVQDPANDFRGVEAHVLQVGPELVGMHREVVRAGL